MNSGKRIRGMNWLSGLAIAPDIDTNVNKLKKPNQSTGKTRFWMNVRRDEIRFMLNKDSLKPEALSRVVSLMPRKAFAMRVIEELIVET